MEEIFKKETFKPDFQPDKPKSGTTRRKGHKTIDAAAKSLGKLEQVNLSKEQAKRLKKYIKSGNKEEALKILESQENKRELTPGEQKRLLSHLEKRLSQKPKHYERPKGVNFAEVEKALKANLELMWSLAQMEETGGAPDVLFVTDKEFIFADFSKESPSGRKNLTYKQAVEMAKKFGKSVNIMTEQQYRKMQKTGEFDKDSLSWLESADIIKTGRARDGDRTYGGVRVNRAVADYHGSNRGWRASLKVPKF